ncbi:MAG: hypothetical protein GY749_36750 [Desulfobacteraceae bacterium]|nr:hypothetical protein [Desulfobacteraceae bacterium]
MKIHQFNIQFSPEEDRIIFRLNTVNKEEFRFFFTRRFVKLLWPVLLKLLENGYKAIAPEKSHVAKDLLEFEHDSVVSKADFTQKYSENVQTYPLGEDIILLNGIKVKQNPKGNVLCFFASKGKGIEFQVDNTFLHTFCEILNNVVKKAGWDMKLVFPRRIQGEAVPSDRVLH